ncbi:MAG: MFS transporter [Acidipropionibacterium sp.]|jgi:predicted MFS family arabinose efflux permease|nr:MFS transporter [Acidipropionibacterium sp.]
MTPVLSRNRMGLFATAAGTLVANIYYAQPLLADIARGFGRRPEQAGLLVTLAQLGYALGVLLIVPLGDGVDRRRLVSIMLTICAGSLVAASLSAGFAMLALASLVVGVASSATMVLVPYVASHAADAERGRRTGQVMTGLLLGILLARTVSGFVAEWTSWRVIYALAAVAVSILAIALRRAMVTDPPRPHIAYRRLLGSLATLVRTQPELRHRAFYALLALGSFSVLWTGLTYLLAAPPYSYSTAAIGLFGLLGAAGAASASIAGRLGDRGLESAMTGVLALLLLGSWGALAPAGRSMVWLIVGIIVLDAAAQGLQVTHQSVLYSIDADARSRITAVFITSGFIGMSLGSALAGVMNDAYGWTGVCLIGATLPAVLLASWLVNAALDRFAAS